MTLVILARWSRRRQTRLIPSAATWRTGRNIHVVIYSGAFAPLCENMTSSTKPEVHNHIALQSEEDRATATCNMHRKFGEI